MGFLVGEVDELITNRTSNLLDVHLCFPNFSDFLFQRGMQSSNSLIKELRMELHITMAFRSRVGRRAILDRIALTRNFIRLWSSNTKIRAGNDSSCASVVLSRVFVGENLCMQV